MVSNAEGDAARFKQVLAEYSKAPGVMRERLYQDMMQQILSNSSKVLVDQKSGSNLLYLPLDKLIQQTHPQQAGARRKRARLRPICRRRRPLNRPVRPGFANQQQPRRGAQPRI